MSAVSSEFSLTVECCRWAFAGGDRNQIVQLCTLVDWARFIRIVRFHRVQGLVWDCLSATAVDLPSAAAQALSADAESIMAANLRMAAETNVLRKQFVEA